MRQTGQSRGSSSSRTTPNSHARSHYRMKLLGIFILLLGVKVSQATWALTKVHALKCVSPCIRNSCYTARRTKEACDPSDAHWDGKLLMTQKRYCWGECDKHYGSHYNWCYTYIGLLFSRWDYCNPCDKVRQKQHISITNAYCIGPCVMADYSYYWCRVSLSWNDPGWDYCSPREGITRYGLQCRADSPCQWNYGSYTCLVEPNNQGLTYDYCSPPFDLYDAIDDRSLDFGGNFGPAYKYRFTNFDGCDQLLHEENRHGQYLYRILDNDNSVANEGNGLHGLFSGWARQNYTRLQPMRITVPIHVGKKTRTSVWISTSTNMSLLHCAVHRKMNQIAHSNVREIFIVTIDTCLLDEHNTVVDLRKENIAKELFPSSDRARSYARSWDMMLVNHNVPSKAIVSSRRFFINQADHSIDWEDVSNENYQRNKACKPMSYTEESFASDT